MKKRQWKKFKKKVRLDLRKEKTSRYTWREKLLLAKLLAENLREEITREIDKEIIAKIHEAMKLPEYLVTGKPIFPDNKHRGRMYPTRVFDKEVS